MAQKLRNNPTGYSGSSTALVLTGDPSLKVPPQSLEVEKTVLGSMLIDVNACDTGMELLNNECFYSTRHQKIFAAMRQMYIHECPIDIVTLAEELRKNQALEDAGGEAFLSELVEQVATAANIEQYAKILKAKATLRNLISASSEIATECFRADADARQVVDAAEAKIFQISSDNERNKPQQLRELLSATFEDIERFGREGGSGGVLSGFKDLDEKTTGFHPGDLVIIAARPGMGKTALCLSMAVNTTIHTKIATPTVVFSLEMSKQQLVQRMLCSEAEIDIHRMRAGKLSKAELNRLGLAAGPLHAAPLFIDDTPAINVMEIRAKCRRLKSKHNLGLVIIDYLQLMSNAEWAENRQQEIAQISRALKGIAKELEIPVIALAQLSRAVEQRTGNHKPQLSDLRESGAIEQDADLVLFVYRECKYKPEEESLKNVAELIIGKQRNGPVGSVMVSFIEEFANFRNLETAHTEPGF